MRPTPGPWFARQTFSGNWDIAAEDGDGKTLARTEKESDARLIAASPDLFECAASFVRRFGAAVECDEEINGGDAVDWIGENMAEFKNALKKAREVKA
jgi:hypothetical protein